MNIDSAILIGFLAINLSLGLWSSRKIQGITEYAIGDRKFSTATIAATIVSTWVSGDYIFLGVTEAYANGLNFIWVVVLGDFLSLFLIGALFAPRMKEFLGKLSIADAMGSLYGDKVRIVTAISGLIGVCGIIATQFKLAGSIFEYALELPSIYGTISAAVVVTLYSSLGGVKSVTFTDIIQFITFGTVIPIIAYMLFGSLENINLVTNIITNDARFDYREVFDFSNTKSLYYLFIAVFFTIPAFNPAIFQRIAMASSVKQVSSSFIIASITCVFLVLIVSWIGVLMLAIHPNISSNDIVRHIISDYSFIIGYKGIVLAGIMAMIMSTVDSFINSSAVILTHDIFNTLKIRFINELFTARVVALWIGGFSLILSLRDNSLLELIIVTYSLYMPVVTVPFIMSILGFR
ncbi:MAG: sodium:solute symporter family protein, partial [Rickettsiaceae bacterium]|nr:sodium:solute symporter family protein [Rickettsiaceae bacterium]